MSAAVLEATEWRVFTQGKVDYRLRLTVALDSVVAS
jgi:hypothetical protein